MKKLKVLISLLCALATSSVAQEKSLYSLAGIVVNSHTGEPIQRALVQIRQMPNYQRPVPGQPFQPNPQGLFSASAFTDAMGLFHFIWVPDSTYTLAASKPQYIPDGAGGPQNGLVTLNANVDNVSLRLSPLGVIEGKVVDQNGQPLRGIAIAALSLQINDGWRTTVGERNVSTDDRGAFRLWNLRPGKYYIKAAGRNGSVEYVGDTAPAFVWRDSFAPVYFGGGHILESATPVVLEAGGDAHANLTLTMEPAFRIAGVLTNFVPHHPVKFELLSGHEEVAANRVSLNSDNGRFEIQDVVPGSYILRATQGTETRSEAPIHVSNSDVAAANLNLVPAVDLPYQVRVVGIPADLEDPETGKPIKIEPDQLQAMCSIEVWSGGQPITQSQRVPRQVKNPDSSAGSEPQTKLAGLLPGSYNLTIACGASYVTSALWGSQDLLANPEITIQPGAAPPPVEIVAHLGGGSVQGKLVLKSQPTEPPGILLVPQFSGSTGPVMEPLYGQGTERQFSFQSLAPGDYLAYAFSHCEDIEFRNPAFLRNLSGGVLVHVQEGADSNAEITINGIVQ
jgi:hypothetical protein